MIKTVSADCGGELNSVPSDPPAVLRERIGMEDGTGGQGKMRGAGVRKT